MKWGAVKMARQRASRLRKQGIETDALATFEEGQKVIRENKAMSRSQKSAANERLAKAFMASGMSTKTDIMTRADRLSKKNKYTAEYMEHLKKQEGGGLKEIEAYLDTTDNNRAVIAAKHYVPSETIKKMADIQEDINLSINDFYKMVHNMTVYARQTKNGEQRSADQINDYITILTERAKNGTL